MVSERFRDRLGAIEMISRNVVFLLMGVARSILVSDYRSIGQQRQLRRLGREFVRELWGTACGPLR
jgi:hypothetical protein